MNEKWIVSVEVVLKNNGKGKIQAWSGGDGKLAYKDALEELKRPCSLQLKRISSTVEQDNQYLNWYNSASLVSVPDIPSEINLLDDYVMTDDHNRVEFWLESGDTVHLPATLILNPGNYLGKISFYGRKPKKDFWTRFVFLNLEECGTTA